MCNTSAKSAIPVQITQILDYDWLIDNTAFERTNQIFCFQLKRAPWMAQFFALFFFCYRTVCYRTVQQSSRIQSCSLNQPITFKVVV